MADTESVEVASLRPAFRAFDQVSLRASRLSASRGTTTVFILTGTWLQDGNKTLTKKELEEVRKSFKIEPLQFEALLKKIDLNEDGKIDFREFMLLADSVLKHSSNATEEREAEEAAKQSASGISPILLGAGAVAIAALAFVLLKRK